MLIACPPWIACRTWLAGKADSRSFISNELTHEFIQLDAEASDIWCFIAERGRVSRADLKRFAEDIGVGDEIDDFVTTLQDGRYLTIAGETLSASAMPPPPPLPMGREIHQTVELDMMEWVQGKGFLWCLFWEITYRCNETCIHCFNPGAAHLPGEKPDRNRAELTTEEAFRLIDEAVSLGVFKLVLSGGEALLRRDLLDIIAYARSRRLSVELYTNGLALDDAALGRLATLWPHRVSISLYSTTPVLHDRVTRVPGSFERSVAALKRLHAAGIKTVVKSLQMQDTVQGYHLTRALAVELGASVQLDMGLTPGLDGNTAPLDLAITDFNELVVMAATPESPLWVGDAETRWSQQDAHQRRHDPICGAGRTIISVDPEGTLFACNSMPVPVGTFRDGGLSALWQAAKDETGHPLHRIRQTVWADQAECGSHDRCGWCRRCPGQSVLETGDAAQPSSFNCEQAQARMIAAHLLQQGVSVDDIHQQRGVPNSFGFRAGPRTS